MIEPKKDPRNETEYTPYTPYTPVPVDAPPKPEDAHPTERDTGDDED